MVPPVFGSTTEPTRCFFFPTRHGNGFGLNIYETLLRAHNIVIYEIKKPTEVIPYCFVVRRFVDHVKFFHDVAHTDGFDTDQDQHYLRRLWYLMLPHQGIYDPDHFDLSIAEDEEPELIRGHGRAVLLRIMLSLTTPYELFEEEEESVVDDERSLTPPPMERETIGR